MREFISIVKILILGFQGLLDPHRLCPLWWNYLCLDSLEPHLFSLEEEFLVSISHHTKGRVKRQDITE